MIIWLYESSWGPSHPSVSAGRLQQVCVLHVPAVRLSLYSQQVPARAHVHARTHTHTCTHGRTHRPAQREISAFISTHINTHSTHRREHHRWPHPIPPPRAVGIGGRICAHPHSWFTFVGSLNTDTDFKSIQYLWPIPTHRLRLWVFPYTDLFLLTGCSNLKFMSILHTQTHGVTHTENRVDLKEVMTGSGSRPLGLPGFCLLALFIPFFLPDPTWSLPSPTCDPSPKCFAHSHSPLKTPCSFIPSSNSLLKILGCLHPKISPVPLRKIIPLSLYGISGTELLSLSHLGRWDKGQWSNCSSWQY